MGSFGKTLINPATSKKPGDPPPPPDPNVVSAAQTKSNVDTANANATLNRTNQITPWGTETYTAGTPSADGTSQWTSTTTLDPAQQKLLDSSNRISQSMSDLGERQIGNVGDSITRPLNFSGLASATPGQMSGQIADSGQVQGGINMSGVGDYQHGANYGTIQNDVMGNNGVTNDSLAAAMKDAQGAAYKQQTGYLDPQWQQSQHDLENKLTQQGVMQNSDAWNRAIDDESRNKTFAYNQANQAAVAQGNAAQAQLYGEGLSSSNFHNASQGQGFGQAQTNAQLNKSATAAEFAQAQAQQAASNAAQAQRFGQNASQTTLSNNATQGNFTNNLASRDQGINELMTQQQNPLNVLNALRTGSQVTAPTFGQGPQSTVANTDTMSPTNNAFNGQMGAYNSSVAQSNANTGAAASLGAAALAAF